MRSSNCSLRIRANPNGCMQPLFRIKRFQFVNRRFFNPYVHSNRTSIATISAMVADAIAARDLCITINTFKNVRENSHFQANMANADHLYADHKKCSGEATTAYLVGQIALAFVGVLLGQFFGKRRIGYAPALQLALQFFSRISRAASLATISAPMPPRWYGAKTTAARQTALSTRWLSAR